MDKEVFTNSVKQHFLKRIQTGVKIDLHNLISSLYWDIYKEWIYMMVKLWKNNHHGNNILTVLTKTLSEKGILITQKYVFYRIETFNWSFVPGTLMMQCVWTGFWVYVINRVKVNGNQQSFHWDLLIVNKNSICPTSVKPHCTCTL